MGYVEGILISTCINIVCVCGLTLLTGYIGLFSMGHACFLSIGAYVAAILSKYYGVPYLAALLAGGGVAAVSSVIIGYPTLRGKLSSDCFAIATLGFSEAVRLLLSNFNHPYVGGALGISGIPHKTGLPQALIFAALSIFLVFHYTRSQHGRIALAIRDHADASELIGVNIFREKLKTLMISAFFCGFGGGMMAHYYTYIVPNTFGSVMSTNLLTAVVLGGVSSVTGPVLAASVLTAAPEVLRFLANWRLAIYGLVLIVMMRVRPEGLMGHRELSLKPLVSIFQKGGRRLRERGVK